MKMAISSVCTTFFACFQIDFKNLTLNKIYAIIKKKKGKGNENYGGIQGSNEAI